MCENEIILPEGWEIDRQEGNKLILKEKKPELPNTWEKCLRKLAVLEKDLSFINDDGAIFDTSLEGEDDYDNWKNIFPKEYATPMLALMQLLVCYKAWVEEEPNWTNPCTFKYVIWVKNGLLCKDRIKDVHQILTFSSKQLCDKFFDTFQFLLYKAKPLL
jgi:hypothetical protein